MADRASLEAEIRGWDELIAEHGDERDPQSREQVAAALMQKSAVLAWELERPEEAIHVWDEVYRRYAAAPEPALRESADAALWKKALTFVELNQRSAALGVYREIATRRLSERGGRPTKSTRAPGRPTTLSANSRFSRLLFTIRTV